jgi:drug/metabolite transporter (DMT)-like permease
MSSQFKGILYAIITAIMWGLLAIALKISLSDLSAADITWFRFLSAFMVLTAYYLIRKPGYLRILNKPPLLLIIASLCLALNYFGFISGVHMTSPSIAQVFIQLGPSLLAISGIFLFGEEVSARQVTGMLIVLAGLTVFYHEQLQVFVSQKGTWNMGVAWVIIAAIAWAAYSILLKILVLNYPPMQLNLVIFGLPALIYLPFVNFSHFLSLSFTGWLILLFLGMNTLVAYGLLALSMGLIDANKVSAIIIMNPVITFILMAIISRSEARWISHEHFTALTLAGAFFVLTGAFLTVLRIKRNDPHIRAV